MATAEHIEAEYQGFDNGSNTAGAAAKAMETEKSTQATIKEKLTSETIFAGPISDSCKDGFDVIDKRITLLWENMETIKEYLLKAKDNYKSADKNAMDLYLSIKKDGKITYVSSKEEAATMMANTITANSTSASSQALITALRTEEGNTFKDYKGKFYFPDDWCAEWVSIKLKENGYKCDYATVAGTEDGYKSIIKAVADGGGTVHFGPVAKGKEEVGYVAQPGDVFVIDTDGDGSPNHTGIVIKDNGDGTLTTIEGNTMKEGQTKWIKNQGVVRERTDRKVEDIYAYATPKKAK